MDGYFKVDFCKICGAEGLMLSEECPQKFISTDSKISLDEKKQTSK
jgi:hypothetical protein